MIRAKSEIDLLSEISGKLDRLIGIMAIQGKPIDDQIRILHGLGSSWEEIGPLVGMKPAAARMRYTRNGK